MTNTQRGILILIKAALTGKAPDPYQENCTGSGICAQPDASNQDHTSPLPPDFDIAEAYKEIRRHQITPLAYAGAVLCGIPKDHPVMQQMFQIYLQQMFHSENQMAAVSKIFATFDQHGIDYLPLKGSTLKSLYPKPEYRLMGDADILIKTDQYPQIEQIMPTIGFTFKGESDHELVWQTPHLYVELHKRLIPSYNKDYYTYYNDGWQLAAPALSAESATNITAEVAHTEPEPAQPALSANHTAPAPQSLAQHGRHTFKTPEDEFIFIFTHFAKHYRDGGIGCRQAIDLYVFRMHNPQMNEQYIMEVFKKLQLNDFYMNMQQTLEVWFGEPSAPADTASHSCEPCKEDVKGTTATDLITEYIFSSGNWGNIQSHMIANMIKAKQTTGAADTSKVKDFLRRAMPDYETMSYMYPTLKKHPYLLPVYWGVRITTTVFCRRELFNKKMEAYKASTDDSIQTFQDSLEYVGLGFNFEK